MTPAARQAVITQSQIVQFILSKKQVKQESAHNRINSPVQNFILSDDRDLIASISSASFATQVDLSFGSIFSPRHCWKIFTK